MRPLTQCLVAFVVLAGTHKLEAEITTGDSFNFSITYDGVSQSLDTGSDPMTGTVLLAGDRFMLDFHTAGSDYWEVLDGDWDIIYAALWVSPHASRTGDSTATFLMDGAPVAQDIDLGAGSEYVHIGPQQATLSLGLMFDQLIVDYSLISDTSGSATIVSDTVHFSFLDYPSKAVYVPEPTTLALAALALLGLIASTWRRSQHTA